MQLWKKQEITCCWSWKHTDTSEARGLGFIKTLGIPWMDHSIWWAGSFGEPAFGVCTRRHDAAVCEFAMAQYFLIVHSPVFPVHSHWQSRKEVVCDFLFSLRHFPWLNSLNWKCCWLSGHRENELYICTDMRVVSVHKTLFDVHLPK